jgi:hypothetical protein
MFSNSFILALNVDRVPITTTAAPVRAATAHLRSYLSRQFAATDAECVFINGHSKQVIAPIVADNSPASRWGGPQPSSSLRGSGPV